MPKTSIVSAINILDSNPLEQHRKLELRASYQPFCPRRYYLEKKYEFPNVRTLRNDLITSVGTAIHETMQTWLPLELEIYGSWKCDKCGFGKTYDWHIGPCPKCNSLLTYVELDIKNDEFGITGHVDGIARIKNKVYLLEYKTTATPVKVEEVYPAHRLQDTFYAFEVEKKYNIKIEEICVLYIGRNVSINISGPKYGERVETLRTFSFQPDINVYNSYLDAIRYANDCIERKKLPCWGICKNKTAAKKVFCPEEVQKICLGKCTSPASRNQEIVNTLMNLTDLSISFNKWSKGTY